MFTLIKTNDFTNTKTIKTVEIQVLFSILFGLIFDIEVNHMEYFMQLVGMEHLVKVGME